MSEGKTEAFHNFGSLKDHSGQPEQNARQRELQEIADLYDKTLRGKYDKVPGASFDLKQLGRYGQVSFGKTSESQPGQSTVWVRLGYTRFNENNQPKLSILNGFISENEDTGIISVKLPKNFPISQADLSKMVLKRIESMNVEKLHVTTFAAFEREAKAPSGRRGREIDRVIGPDITAERQQQFEILRSGQGFLFEAISNVRTESEGKVRYPYNGYHAFVYSNGFVLEGPSDGHAAYVVKFDEPLAATEDPGTYEDREELFNQVRTYLQEAPTRRELEQKFEAKRVVHLGNWQEKLQQHTAQLSEAKTKEDSA